jgi:hypothetical protein
VEEITLGLLSRAELAEQAAGVGNVPAVAALGALR